MATADLRNAILGSLSRHLISMPRLCDASDPLDAVGVKDEEVRRRAETCWRVITALDYSFTLDAEIWYASARTAEVTAMCESDGLKRNQTESTCLDLALEALAASGVLFVASPAPDQLEQQHQQFPASNSGCFRVKWDERKRRYFFVDTLDSSRKCWRLPGSQASSSSSRTMSPTPSETSFRSSVRPATEELREPAQPSPLMSPRGSQVHFNVTDGQEGRRTEDEIVTEEALKRLRLMAEELQSWLHSVFHLHFRWMMAWWRRQMTRLGAEEAIERRDVQFLEASERVALSDAARCSLQDVTAACKRRIETLHRTLNECRALHDEEAESRGHLERHAASALQSVHDRCQSDAVLKRCPAVRMLFALCLEQKEASFEACLEATRLYQDGFRWFLWGKPSRWRRQANVHHDVVRGGDLNYRTLPTAHSAAVASPSVSAAAMTSTPLRDTLKPAQPVGALHSVRSKMDFSPALNSLQDADAPYLHPHTTPPRPTPSEPFLNFALGSPAAPDAHHTPPASMQRRFPDGNSQQSHMRTVPFGAPQHAHLTTPTPTKAAVPSDSPIPSVKSAARVLTSLDAFYLCEEGDAGSGAEDGHRERWEFDRDMPPAAPTMALFSRGADDGPRDLGNALVFHAAVYDSTADGDSVDAVDSRRETPLRMGNQHFYRVGHQQTLSDPSPVFAASVEAAVPRESVIEAGAHSSPIASKGRNEIDTLSTVMVDDGGAMRPALAFSTTAQIPPQLSSPPSLWRWIFGWSSGVTLESDDSVAVCRFCGSPPSTSHVIGSVEPIVPPIGSANLAELLQYRFRLVVTCSPHDPSPLIGLAVAPRSPSVVAATASSLQNVTLCGGAVATLHWTDVSRRHRGDHELTALWAAATDTAMASAIPLEDWIRQVSTAEGPPASNLADVPPHRRAICCEFFVELERVASDELRLVTDATITCIVKELTTRDVPPRRPAPPKTLPLLRQRWIDSSCGPSPSWSPSFPTVVLLPMVVFSRASQTATCVSPAEAAM